MKFKASFGSIVYVITISCFILFLVVSRVVFLRNESLGYQVLVALTLWLTFLLCYLYHPVAYSINATFLYIHRPISNLAIPRNEIRNFRQVPEEEMKWTIRTWGVGGLFGYFGKFTNTNIGRMTLYATQRTNYVLLELTDRKIILTPDDPSAFIAALK